MPHEQTFTFQQIASNHGSHRRYGPFQQPHNMIFPLFVSPGWSDFYRTWHLHLRNTGYFYQSFFISPSKFW